MSYAIIRNANYKKENLAGLYKHNERKNINYSNEDIKKENGIKNYSLKNPNTTYTNFLNKIIKENNLKGRIIKTTNVMCEFIITSDKEFFEEIGEEETKRYFKTAYEFVSNYNNLGEKYIVSAKIHMDETTPHMHLVFVPVVQIKDKNNKKVEKIACSQYWQGKDSYRKLQDNFYEYITKAGFNLERGKTSQKEHISTEKFKEITGYENIKYELENNKIEELKTNNLNEILEQNKRLIKYSNTLKGYYTKSLKAIDKCMELEEENNNLKNENIELKHKNKKLVNYIELIFSTMKNVFKISKEKIIKEIKSKYL